LEGVKTEGKLNQFFEILSKQAERDKSLINLILTNYFSWLGKYNPNEADKNLKQILKNKQLNPKMLTFLKGIISEIER
jgi:hypothetical protein